MGSLLCRRLRQQSYESLPTEEFGKPHNAHESKSLEPTIIAIFTLLLVTIFALISTKSTYATQNMSNPNEKIPKVIHYTLDKPFPEFEEAWNFHDWKIKYWSDDDLSNFVKENFPHYEDKFNSLTIIEKTDWARYMIIYIEGGVYADSDVRPKASETDINKWFQDGINLYSCIEFWGSFMIKLHLTQWFFASSKGNPAILKIIENVATNIDAIPLTDDKSVLWRTGPWVFANSIIESMGKENEAMIDQYEWEEPLRLDYRKSGAKVGVFIEKKDECPVSMSKKFKPNSIKGKGGWREKIKQLKK